MTRILAGFACAFLLSRVRLHEVHAPLALALLLACSLTDTEPIGVFGGVAIGALIGKSPMWHTFAAACAFSAVMRILTIRRVRTELALRLLLFLGSAILTLPLNTVYGTKELWYGLLSLVAALVSAPVYGKLIKCVRTVRTGRVLTEQEQAVLALAIGSMLLTVSEFTLFGWSLSVMLLLFCTAAAIDARGVYGAAASVVWASMLTFYTKAEPLLLGTTAFAAFLAVTLRSRGKLFVFLSFLLSAILFSAYLSESAYAVNAQNLLSGGLIYLLLPRKWREQLRDLINCDRQAERTRRSTIERIEQNASERIGQMGELLKGFSSMFTPLTAEEDATVRWTTQTALGVCRACGKRKQCWKDAERMQETILSLAKDADAGKRVTTVDPIDAFCTRFDNLCNSVVLAYQQALSREAVLEKAKEQSAFANRQFLGVGSAMQRQANRLLGAERGQTSLRKRAEEQLTESGVTVLAFDWTETGETQQLRLTLRRPLHKNRDEVRAMTERACGFSLRTLETKVERQAVTFVFERDARLHASMHVTRSDGDRIVSGDAAGECRLSGGRVCFALSDGMGRGPSARAESEEAIGLLFRLYRAGMERELIYDTVNRLLMARSETEMYATLDAVSIDLNTGEAEILKYGAPPSFLLRKDSITAIDGEALPCGILAEAKPSLIRIRLRADDRLVFCTDGVQDVLPDGTEQTLKRLNESAEAMDSALYKIAKSRHGTDDMTVMVIHVA